VQSQSFLPHIESTHLNRLSASSERPTDAIRPQAIALGVFGALVALALLILVAQGLNQLLDRSSAQLELLGALGMTRAEVALAGGLEGAVAVVAGIALAVGGAVASSPQAHGGSARSAGLVDLHLITAGPHESSPRHEEAGDVVETGIGSGNRPGHGACLLGWSANFTQSAYWEEVIGISGTPSTTSARACGAGTVGAVLACSSPLGADVEHAVNTDPLIRAAARIKDRLMG
jgi:hypothetical protein